MSIARSSISPKGIEPVKFAQLHLSVHLLLYSIGKSRCVSSYTVYAGNHFVVK